VTIHIRWPSAASTSLRIATIGLTLLALAYPHRALSEEPSSQDQGSASIQVTAAVRGLHLAVIGADGQIDEVWSNTSASDAAVVFRAGALGGPDVIPDANLVDRYRGLASTIDWTLGKGSVWQRSSEPAP
jgi:hypothetical protein